MDESTKNSPCKECRDGVGDQANKEVEHLRQHLAEQDAQFVALEAEYFKCTSRANDLEEQVSSWREKYERLYDSHKRVQKLNQVLEDKLLQMVDKMKSEKNQLTKDIATLSVRLAESKHNYSMLQKENERYKNDMNLAIQLLQCKPDNFVSHKLDNLPVDTQARVSQYVMSKTTKTNNPSQPKNSNDIDTFDASEYEFNISASLMSKILEDSIQDSVTKHCDTCTCSKSQSKPFCYNESYYSVSTQTLISGDLKTTLCTNCNVEIKSMNSILSIRSDSPHGITIVNEKSMAKTPLYILPQPDPIIVNNVLPQPDTININNIEPGTSESFSSHVNVNDILKPEDTYYGPKDALQTLEEEFKLKKNNTISMEPAVHHKLCDRTRTSMSSKKSSIHSVGNEDLLIKDFGNKEIKLKSPISQENNILTKGSHSSMGAGSRTSSIAKSTVSTHKSNTQVGPGPRFCHLRMQAGSKNILLDNAEPDVPPVLYRRQSKTHDSSIFKDLNDDFIDLEKNDDNKIDIKKDNLVVETTLIDVHVDSTNKETCEEEKTASINPVLLNVSSSPLQPLKSHNFPNNTEFSNNNSNVEDAQNTSEIDTLLNDFQEDTKKDQIETFDLTSNKVEKPKLKQVLTPNNNQQMKIFNFDRYEQSKADNQYTRPLKKIDMSKLHSLENTKISKDCPPLCDFGKDLPQKPSTPNIVNVYPNLTQTNLKVNETKNVFTNEQSTSSMSSDDSAAMLQKQQLLRVAEWVEKNLEQQNNLNDPLEEECSYAKRAIRRESKISRLTETLNELALNMPHPVSKYSKSYSRESRNSWANNISAQAMNSEQSLKQCLQNPKLVSNVAKETIFPVECGDDTVTEINKSKIINHTDFDVNKELRDALKEAKGDKSITPEDLARMEYNVKKFLLSGPYWVNPGSVGRSRRTSSKTETDV